MIFNQDSFAAIEFQSMAAKLNSLAPNYRKETYASTQRGKIDATMLIIVLIAKKHWSEQHDEPITVAQIKRNVAINTPEWIPEALIKLRNMGMIKLALNNSVIGQGDNWIENETACEDGQTVAA